LKKKKEVAKRPRKKPLHPWGEGRFQVINGVRKGGKRGVGKRAGKRYGGGVGRRAEKGRTLFFGAENNTGQKGN